MSARVVIEQRLTMTRSTEVDTQIRIREGEMKKEGEENGDKSGKERWQIIGAERSVKSVFRVNEERVRKRIHAY